jgi:hypothetical protein
MSICKNGVIFFDRVAVLCSGGQRQPVVRRVKVGCVPRLGLVDLWDAVVKVDRVYLCSTQVQI